MRSRVPSSTWARSRCPSVGVVSDASRHRRSAGERAAPAVGPGLGARQRSPGLGDPLGVMVTTERTTRAGCPGTGAAGGDAPRASPVLVTDTAGDHVRVGGATATHACVVDSPPAPPPTASRRPGARPLPTRTLRDSTWFVASFRGTGLLVTDGRLVRILPLGGAGDAPAAGDSPRRSNGRREGSSDGRHDPPGAARWTAARTPAGPAAATTRELETSGDPAGPAPPAVGEAHGEAARRPRAGSSPRRITGGDAPPRWSAPGDTVLRVVTTVAGDSSRSVLEQLTVLVMMVVVVVVAMGRAPARTASRGRRNREGDSERVSMGRPRQASVTSGDSPRTRDPRIATNRRLPLGSIKHPADSARGNVRSAVASPVVGETAADWKRCCGVGEAEVARGSGGPAWPGCSATVSLQLDRPVPFCGVVVGGLGAAGSTGLSAASSAGSSGRASPVRACKSNRTARWRLSTVTNISTSFCCDQPSTAARRSRLSGSSQSSEPSSTNRSSLPSAPADRRGRAERPGLRCLLSGEC
mmetsp:Transcript_107113/g.245199  ORF Transcript_107113/g.245199 Transcript_107113/m.245199 type:complete len:527 (+) Transcript_107113:237-1817(+)